MIKITTYNTYLGAHLANLEDALLAKERDVYQRLQSEGASDTKSKEMAKLESREEKIAYKKYTLLHSDADKVANRIQSRIKVLEAERKGDI